MSKRKEIHFIYQYLMPDIRVATFDSVKTMSSFKFKDLISTIENDICFVRVWGSDQPFNQCSWKILIGKKTGLLPEEMPPVIHKFLQELLDTIIDYSSFYKYKYNSKSAKEEAEYMKLNVIFPF